MKAWSDGPPYSVPGGLPKHRVKSRSSRRQQLLCTTAEEMLSMFLHLYCQLAAMHCHLMLQGHGRTADYAAQHT